MGRCRIQRSIKRQKMPKQIIIQHPWKGVLNGDKYELYYYYHWESKPLYICIRGELINPETYEYVNQYNHIIRGNPTLYSLIKQCQTELNNNSERNRTFICGL
jgi:hypothetical protein